MQFACLFVAPQWEPPAWVFLFHVAASAATLTQVHCWPSWAMINVAGGLPYGRGICSPAHRPLFPPPVCLPLCSLGGHCLPALVCAGVSTWLCSTHRRRVRLEVGRDRNCDRDTNWPGGPHGPPLCVLAQFVYPSYIHGLCMQVKLRLASHCSSLVAPQWELPAWVFLYFMWLHLQPHSSGPLLA